MSCADVGGVERDQLAGVAAEGLDHRDVVGAHQPEPRVLGLARCARQVVVAEVVDVRRTRLPGDLLEHGGGEHLAAEDGRHAELVDLLDEAGDLARGRLPERRRLDRADDRPAVVGGPVRVGVVVREEQALVLGDGGGPGPHRLVERVDLDPEGGQVGRVRRGVVGVGGGEDVGGEVGVLAGEDRVGPQMRVRLAAVLGEGEVVAVLVLRQDARAELADRRAIGCVGVGEQAGGLLELEPVEEHDVGVGERGGLARRRLERVAVRALGHDAHDRGVRPGGEVGDDARDRCHRGHHPQRPVGDDA